MLCIKKYDQRTWYKEFPKWTNKTETAIISQLIKLKEK